MIVAGMGHTLPPEAHEELVAAILAHTAGRHDQRSIAMNHHDFTRQRTAG
ncbi:hypothetical protein ACFWDZ_17130 [Micromonospora aurantiaca]|nr:hypothetical protein [Micromonospora aurantiaca]